MVKSNSEKHLLIPCVDLREVWSMWVYVCKSRGIFPAHDPAIVAV